MSIDIDKVKKEAKEILGNFGKALAKVKIERTDKGVIVKGFREEGKSKNSDENFRKIMFENAPYKSGDSIIAESKEW